MRPAQSSAFLLTIVALISVLPAQPEKPPDRAKDLARVVPILRLHLAGPMQVEFCFENTSRQVIRYMPGGDGTSFMDLQFTLSRDGQRIPSRVSEPLVAVDKARVKELKPAEALIHRLDLTFRYGALKPGRYALDAHVDGVPRSDGVTDIGFRQRVLYIDVAEREADKT